jgi:hypothetical protein
MTATQLRYRRYLKQTRSALAIAKIFREYPQFIDYEFTFTDRSVTIFVLLRREKCRRATLTVKS